MSKQLFVNLPVKDLARSKAFFGELGLPFFGMTDDMASVMISAEAQVMLVAEPTFASFTAKPVGDPAASTQVILVIGLENPAEVDEFAAKAVAAGGTALGGARETDGRYQRGFADPDGHHWEALCLAGA